jgi:type II secretory pathway pseudopilin PulG
MLVELLVVFALFMILLPALLTGMVASRQGKPQQNQRLEGITHLRELEDAVRSIRDKGWITIDTNGVFHPTSDGTTWSLSSGSETENGFSRTVQIDDVYRDANGAITTNGGTLDPSTKKATVVVGWTQPYVSNMSSVMYLSRFQNNTAYNQTNQADFDSGTKTNVQTTNTSGGEVILANNTKGKWCSPQFSSTTISLPDGPPVAIDATSSSTLTTPSDIFTAIAPNDTNVYKLSYITIPQNVDPPAPTPKGTFTLDSGRYSNSSYFPTGLDLDNSFRTNSVKYYFSSGGNQYALLATDNPNKEVVVVQIKNGGNDAYQDPVNKIYKYWTFFNTNIYSGSTTSYDSGFHSPSAQSAETLSAGDNNGYESNPTRAYTSDSSYAADTSSGNGNGTSCTGTDKDKHRFYNFNIDVPSGATINGIAIQLDAKVDSTTGSPKMCVQLSWDGGSTWTNTQSTTNLTTSKKTYTLGGSSDTWGHTWTDTQLSNNANFRVRVIDVAGNTSRTFSLDWVAVRVYATIPTNDQAPFGYGASTLAILGNRGYISSGGYLYIFDLSNIDSKSTVNGLDQIGCRIELDGYDCQPSAPDVMKYSAGETEDSWSDTQSTYKNCSSGGNVENYATNAMYGVQVGANNYIYLADGAQTDPELDIVNATNIPNGSSSPSISNSSCGRISGGSSGWQKISSLDLNPYSGTEEASNSIFSSPDGTRAYLTSNGGILRNGGIPDADQYYILNTSVKNSPSFLTSWASTQITPTPGHYVNTASSGFYNGNATNIKMYPRNSLTVFNNSRAILVGIDGIKSGTEPQEYQVLDITNESSPTYCGGINYSGGFNSLAAVTEADNDKFVYLISNSGSSVIKIIQGGPDGTYLDSGTYESNTFDAGAEVAFNRFSSNVTLTAGTDVKYQIAAADAVDNSCTNALFNYVGPDGTDATFFPSTGGTIPIHNDGLGFENPSRCLRYKAYLSTTNYYNTPSVLDVLVNYSP